MSVIRIDDLAIDLSRIPVFTREEAEQTTLAERHLGIIARRCIFWHQYLPGNAKHWYEIEDMISEVVIHVIRRSASHNMFRGRESTLVFHIANNKCLTILDHFNSKKLSACETVDLTPEVERTVSCPNSERTRLAMDAVERVIEYGSDAVVELVDAILSGRLRQMPPEDVVLDFNHTIRQQSASLDDFMTVLRYAVL